MYIWFAILSDALYHSKVTRTRVPYCTGSRRKPIGIIFCDIVALVAVRGYELQTIRDSLL